MESLEKYFTISSSTVKRKWSESPQILGKLYKSHKRRQRAVCENQWRCSDDMTDSNHTVSPSVSNPHYPNNEALIQRNSTPQFCLRKISTNTELCNRSPLPQLKWGDAQDVWNVMKMKDRKYTRNPTMLSRHPHIQCKMRSILLDWIIEVCEVYRLHRETFYLTVDFIDRFLSNTYNVQKGQLQLIGVSALFIAAKIEEIYPPKIAEFAYVTDGACTETEISNQELVMLKALNWDLTPMTVNTWMTVYLQLLNNKTPQGKETCMTKPLFSGHAFVQIARLMDLCMLDVGSLQFSYGVLAASILYHFSNEIWTFKASGLTWADISACVNWMAPFATIVREAVVVHMKVFENVMHGDCHNIQTHAVDLDMLEKAQARLLQTVIEGNCSSPNTVSRTLPPESYLTPPPSSHKSSYGILT